MADTKTQTKITEVGAVMVPVSDQDKAIEFYTEKLGFEKRADTPFGDGNRWVEVAPPGADTVVALTIPREGSDYKPGIDVPLGFNTDDVKADHAALKDAGVDVDDEIMDPGDPVPAMFMLRDQDGNTLMVVQRSD